MIPGTGFSGTGTGKSAGVYRYEKQKGYYGMGDTLQILTAMIIYMAAVIILGVTFAKRQMQARTPISWAAEVWDHG